MGNCCDSTKIDDKENTEGVIRAQELPIQVGLRTHSAVLFKN